MIRFPVIPPVQSGQARSSRHVNRLQEAARLRVLSGLGDAGERLVGWWYGLLRGMIVPNTPMYAPDAQGFIYQMLSPDAGHWAPDDLPPGEPGGANPNNPLVRYVHGDQMIGGDVAPEVDRTTVYTASAEGTLEECWDLGAAQRGARDPDTGEVASPAMASAEQTRELWYPADGRSVFGTSVGGYQPVAPIRPNEFGWELCYESGSVVNPNPQRRSVWFTRLTGPTAGSRYEFAPGVTETGSCPNVAGDVVVVEAEPLYLLYRCVNAETGEQEVAALSMADWIEGPYAGGGRLTKAPAGMWPVILSAFCGEFRGEDTERAASGGFRVNAFPFQEFLTSQYLLAPALGVASGEGEARVVTPVYPGFRTIIPVAAGTALTCVQNSTDTYGPVPADYGVFGVYVKARRLASAVRIRVSAGGSTVMTVQATPDSGGNADVILWVKEGRPGALQVTAEDAIAFTAGSGQEVAVSLAVLWVLRPSIYDAYLLLRAGMASENAAVDGSGTRESNPAWVATTYFERGCLLNKANLPGLPVDAGTVDVTNRNAVVDAALRLSRMVRVVGRDQIRKYAVVDGQSILWVDRIRNLSGVDIDLFAGIGPSTSVIASGDLQPGFGYVVTIGSVTCEGETYTAGQVFFPMEATTYTGTGIVKEHDGIRPVAPERGLSNEWVMGAWLKLMHPADGNLWKPEAYGDLFGWVDRCVMDAPELGQTDLALWYNHGMDHGLAPEGVSGLRYAGGVMNAPGSSTLAWKWQRLAFHRSCRVHEPLPEIESAVMDGDLLKLTFKTRFHHHKAWDDTILEWDEDHSWPAAPETISDDPATWDTANLRTNQVYRTLENGIMEYLLWKYNSGLPPTFKIGDVGAGSNANDDAGAGGGGDVQGWAVRGAALPHLYFVRLPRMVYEDDNTTPEASRDTPAWHEILSENLLYLRAACEGCVDLPTTRDSQPPTGCHADGTYLQDYSFPNLMLQACGNRWLSLLPLAVRPDNPVGFGPLPGIKRYAEVLTTLGNAWNLLRHYRIDGSYGTMHWRERYFRGDQLLPASGDGAVKGMDGGDAGFAYTGTFGGRLDATGAPPEATVEVLPAGGWNDVPVPPDLALSMVQVSGLGVDMAEERFTLSTRRTDVEYWYEFDALWREALPDGLAELLSSTGPSILMRWQESSASATREACSLGEADRCPEVSGLAVWGNSRWETTTIETRDDCVTLPLGSEARPARMSSALPSSTDCGIGHHASQEDLPSQGCFVGNASTLAGLTVIDLRSVYVSVPGRLVYWGASTEPLLDEAGMLSLPGEADVVAGQYAFEITEAPERFLYLAWPETSPQPLAATPGGDTGFMTGGHNMIGGIADGADGYAESESGWSFRRLTLGGSVFRVYRSKYAQRSSVTVTVRTA